MRAEKPQPSAYAAPHFGVNDSGMFETLDTEGQGGTAMRGETPMTGTRTRPRRRSRILRYAGIGLAAALALYVGGFFLFLSEVSRYSRAPADMHADGIVVLTGGHSRVDEAVKLLDSDMGERLLISGVHPSASWAVLMNTFAVDKAQFACCVDIDRKALDTVGNAEETARWAADHGFHSLIVVTNDYHMPRSLLELHRTMGNIELIPHAVVTGQRGTVSASEQANHYRLLFREYVKYSAARVRALFPAHQAASGVERTALSED
ncbi:MAG: YdcF family protein [Oricola sp.]